MVTFKQLQDFINEFKLARIMLEETAADVKQEVDETEHDFVRRRLGATLEGINEQVKVCYQYNIGQINDTLVEVINNLCALVNSGICDLDNDDPIGGTLLEAMKTTEKLGIDYWTGITGTSAEQQNRAQNN